MNDVCRQMWACLLAHTQLLPVSCRFFKSGLNLEFMTPQPHVPQNSQARELLCLLAA